MSSLDDNIESLSRAMVNEAKAEAEQILSEVQAKADAIRKDAQQRAELERQEILERATREAERLRSQMIATTQMKARTMELDHREKLLQKVFNTSLGQIPSIQEWTNYKDVARQLLKEALLQLKSDEAVIHADAKTKANLPDQVLDQVSLELNMKLIVGAPLEKGTGVMVETKDGHLKFDNTLETRMNRLMSSLRSPVYRLLNGEQL